MTTEQRSRIGRRKAPARMPFRVAAFLLGLLFIGGGLHQIVVGVLDWKAFGFFVLTALTGLQFVYSALTGRWAPRHAWWRRDMVGQIHSRFLVVEPASCVAEVSDGRSDSLERVTNPYSPPRDLPPSSIDGGAPTREESLQTLTHQFLDGYPFIHYGVVLFLEVDDDTAIHAALPLSSTSNVHRNTEEAIRVLPEFLRTLPNTTAVLSGRNLVVRMVSSYGDLDDEVCDRVVVPWEAIQKSGGEQPHAREPTGKPSSRGKSRTQ